MKRTPASSVGRWRGVLVASACALAAAGALSADEVVHDDARIAGKEIHAFTDGGEDVSVVLGGFSLTAGRRAVSGRDGVVWIRTVRTRPAPRHEIVVYVEGDAKAVEADGTTTTDRFMLVRLTVAGRLTAHGTLSKQPLTNFPLYVRARSAREGAAREPEAPRREAPPLVLVPGTPADAEGRPPVAAATTRPEVGADAAPADGAPATRPAPPRAVQPVQLHADSFTSQQIDGVRVTVARGHVYASQGDPDSELFLELRSQAAVVFTERVEKPRTVRSPISPDIGALGGETVTGIYLEGDVVLSRGERFLRCEQAFYDPITDRAYAPDAVFRTVQEQRNIPVYVRAEVARALSAREMYFRNAKVSSSEFHSPTYHIGARETYLMDATPYDEDGEQLGPQSWFVRMRHLTWNIRSVPAMYVPFWQGDFEQGHTALRKASVGVDSRFGFGVETEWHLFRLLGLVKPHGVDARYRLDWYESGLLTGINWDYARQEEMRRYSGYGRIFGLFDGRDDDDFGDERKNIAAPTTRGRFLWRHKEYLPEDWEAQFELSYLCDRNFLEQYWRDEFYAGKDQETLVYAKKQQDNWAFTALAKYRLNRFDTQTESFPDLGFHLVGQPLLGDRLTLFGESHVGFKRYHTANDSAMDRSDIFLRGDVRAEADLPVRLGPVSIVPYATGRATHWCDEPRIDEGYAEDGENCRLYGQVGLRASTSLWRAWPGVQSRVWNLDGLRHIITPEVAAWVAGSGVRPEELYPLDPDIEQHLDRTSGFSFGLHQRLQTRRGAPGAQHVEDWMRLAVVLGVYDNGADPVTGDGRFFLYRPEYSQARNHVNVDYSWYLSDSTTFLADMNYDIDDGKIDRASAGLAVVRDPRLAYYAGMRLLPDMDSAVGAFGVKYQINRKYSITAFEQYDFDFRGKTNLATSVSIVRKFPRWYTAVTFIFDQTDQGDDFGVMISFWPEGVPEVQFGSGRMSLLGRSDEN